MQPYSRTSSKNGSWFGGNYTTTISKVPLATFVYKSVFDSENFKSKFYLGTVFADLNSFLVGLKFSYFYIFSKSTPDQKAHFLHSVRKTQKLLMQ